MRRTAVFFGQCLAVWLLVISGGQWAKAQTASEAPRAVCVATVLKPDGSPADNATVTAQYWTKETGTVRLVVTPAKPDAGKFEIEVPELPLGCTVAVRAEAPGYLRMVVRYNSRKNEEPELPEAVTFKLQEGRTTLGGVVVDGDGKPFEGARVGVWLTPDPANRKPNPPGIPVVDNLDAFNATYTTDKDGKWTGPAVPPGTKAAVKLGVHSVLAANETYYFLLVDADLDRLLDGSYRSVLLRGEMLRGKVLDEKGTPIPGAMVGFTGFGTIPTALPPVRTDAGGDFVLGVAPNQPLSLTARSPGRSSWRGQMVWLTGEKPLEITLKPAALLTGQVVGPDSKPVPGATVTVLNTDPRNRAELAELNTDKAGNFRWTEAPDEAVSAVVSASGFAPATDLKLTPGQSNLIKLDKAPVFTVTVVDAVTGEPLNNFQAELGRLLDINTTWWDDAAEYAKKQRGARLSTPMTLTFDAPTWRQYDFVVRVRAPGYVPARSTAFKLSDGDHSYQFRLVRSQDQTVKVTTPDGKPVAGAKVEVVTDEAYVTPESGVERINAASRAIAGEHVTAADGTVKLPDVGEEFRLVCMTEQGWAMTEPLTKPQDLVLQPWARIEGRSMIGRKPDVRAEVTAYRADGLSSQVSPRLYLRFETKTDDQGRFSFDRAVSGFFTIQTARKNQPPWQSRVELNIAIPPSGTSTVTLGGKGRPVVMKLIYPDAMRGRSDLVVGNSRIDKDQKAPEIPTGLRSVRALPAEQRARAEAQWWRSEEAKAYVEMVNARYNGTERYGLSISADGTARAEDVPPGRYEANFVVRDPNNPALLASAALKFEMPEVTGGQSDEPLNLGEVKLELPTPTTQPAAN